MNLNPKYYEFDKYEIQIDLLETMQEIETYDAETRQKELLKCAISFPYFCHKYVKINHPKRGMIPFVLYKYQRRCVEDYETYRFNILPKFRQGGFTTTTAVWAAWRCLFRFYETIIFLSPSHQQSVVVEKMIQRIISELPSWMKSEIEQSNRQKTFPKTDSKLYLFTPECTIGTSVTYWTSVTYLIVDEAAFVPEMDKCWKTLYPTVSPTDGNCICISTINDVENWFSGMLDHAREKNNSFHVIESDYHKRPEFDTEEWAKQTRAILGEKAWQQEYSYKSPVMNSCESEKNSPQWDKTTATGMDQEQTPRTTPFIQELNREIEHHNA